MLRGFRQRRWRGGGAVRRRHDIVTGVTAASARVALLIVPATSWLRLISITITITRNSLPLPRSASNYRVNSLLYLVYHLHPCLLPAWCQSEIWLVIVTRLVLCVFSAAATRAGGGVGYHHELVVSRSSIARSKSRRNLEWVGGGGLSVTVSTNTGCACWNSRLKKNNIFNNTPTLTQKVYERIILLSWLPTKNKVQLISRPRRWNEI